MGTRAQGQTPRFLVLSFGEPPLADRHKQNGHGVPEGSIRSLFAHTAYATFRAGFRFRLASERARFKLALRSWVSVAM